MAPTNRKVAAMHTVIGKLRSETFMSGIGFGRDEQAGGVFVDPVNDPGARDAADPRQRSRAMVQQRIDQRARCVSRSRVDNHACGFVDHYKVIVFVRDIKRDILRLRLRRRSVWD